MIRTLQGSLGIGLVVALLLAGCVTPPAGTSAPETETSSSAAAAAPAAAIKSAWKNQTYDGHLHKIMVLGVAKTPENRAVFEDAFVGELKARGVDAVASHTLLSDAKQKGVPAINEKIEEMGSDAVLVARLVAHRDAQIAVPGNAFQPPIYYDTWHDFFGYGYQALYMPEALADEDFALLETNVYDAQNKNLVWAGTSATEMAASAHDTIKAAAGAMVGSMAGQSLLAK